VLRVPVGAEETLNTEAAQSDKEKANGTPAKP
jgi:hypothetical protein